jgi:hypothetical protein
MEPTKDQIRASVILENICRLRGVCPVEVKTNISKERELKETRQLVYYSWFRHTKMNYEQMALLFGQNWKSASNAIKLIHGLRQTDKEIKAVVEQVDLIEEQAKKERRALES